ncbi:MAG: ATP-binding protein [Yoonia sp.]
MRQNRRESLSGQIVGSIIIFFAAWVLSLLLVGHNAISLTDTTAAERQERFVTRNLAAEIDGLPKEQQSATVWDEAVLRTQIRDYDWMDENLGTWMQTYFGHNENYVLDASDQPFFATIGEARASPDTYDDRAVLLAPLVAQLRLDIAALSHGLENAYEELVEAAVVTPLLFDTGAAIVSIVPIIPNSGTVDQTPGTESLHVAIRYMDMALAQEIGEAVELQKVAFTPARPESGRAGVPVMDSSGTPIAWLIWEPERPGMKLLMSLLPLLLASLVAIVLLLRWLVQRLKRVSEQLQVSEERLQQSHKLEAVGQLTGGIAHDFNNLLTIIMGNTEIIQEKLDPQHPLRRYADNSAKAADRAAELTSRLLAFSRKQALQPQVVDANLVLAEMAGMLRRTLSEDIAISILPAQGLWRTEVDIGQFEAAILNLAINSRDAMTGGGTLTIETANVFLDKTFVATEPGLAAGDYVLIAVADTGHGIPKSHIARVFEPFFTTKAVGKGTGLGLSMVYGFVKQTGGHISVSSEEGDGTLIKLYFPRHDGDADALEVASVKSHVQHGRETILIVEDDGLILQQLAAQLADLNYDVLAAPSGAPALAMLRERPDIALLLTDVVLPGGMNGQQVAEAARAINPSLRVLYTSGYSENALIHHGRLDHGVELLSKPYRRSELAAKIRKVMDASVSD